MAFSFEFDFPVSHRVSDVLAERRSDEARHQPINRRSGCLVAP